MTEVTQYAPGTPSYVDVSAPDVDAAAAFYTALFGWDCVAAGSPEQTGGYRMFERDGKTVAGLGPVAEGAPPAWTTYISVADADEAAEAARAAGGRVLLEPMDVMTAGRMAMLADPEGAVFAIWQAGDHIGAQIVGEPGALCWNELQTRDPEGAAAFYGALFGWRAQAAAAPDGSEYGVWQLGERAVGGRMVIGEGFPPGVPASWLAYFAVEDADAAVARLRELGGAVLVEPFDTPAGRIAVVADPPGAMFAVMAMSAQMREG